MRRLILALPPLLSLALLVGLGAGPLAADDGIKAKRKGPLVNKEARHAIDLGTRYLIALQREDGSWPSDAGKKFNEHYEVFRGGKAVSHVGVTGLAVLSLLAGGHLPDRGPHGCAMDRAIGFLLSKVDEHGYIASEGTRMYSHAFATLALAEVYGVSRRTRVKEKLQDAVEFTVKCQNKTGGWRYVPFTNDSDMSVTVCQIVALRAARNVGIRVPQATIDRALAYIIKSSISDRDRNGPAGAYWYQPHDQRFNRHSFALCAAGLTALFQAGLYDDEQVRHFIKTHRIQRDTPPPTIRESVAFMNQRYSKVWNRRPSPDHYFYFYGNYYAAQAMYQIGGNDLTQWESWYSRVRDHLLLRMRTSEHPDTGQPVAWWRSNVDTSNAYATACALLILQFLPAILSLPEW